MSIAVAYFIAQTSIEPYLTDNQAIKAVQNTEIQNTVYLARVSFEVAENVYNIFTIYIIYILYI